MKLVRDKVPDDIRANGKEPTVYTASHDELKKLLLDKFKEEVDEFCDAPNEEDLADVVEVVHGLCKHFGWPIEEIEETRMRKREILGSYAGGTVLKNIDKKE